RRPRGRRARRRPDERHRLQDRLRPWPVGACRGAGGLHPLRQRSGSSGPRIPTSLTGPGWFARGHLGRFGDMVGRIPVLDVTPQVEGGAYPAKAAVGEPFEVTAKVIREGHDALNAQVVLVD